MKMARKFLDNELFITFGQDVPEVEARETTLERFLRRKDVYLWVDDDDRALLEAHPDATVYLLPGAAAHDESWTMVYYPKLSPREAVHRYFSAGYDYDLDETSYPTAVGYKIALVNVGGKWTIVRYNPVKDSARLDPKPPLCADGRKKHDWEGEEYPRPANGGLLFRNVCKRCGLVELEYENFNDGETYISYTTSDADEA